LARTARSTSAPTSRGATERPPFAYHAIGKRPLWTLSESAPDTDDLTVVELAPEDGFHHGIIMSRTCDIVYAERRRERVSVRRERPEHTLSLGLRVSRDKAETDVSRGRFSQ